MSKVVGSINEDIRGDKQLKAAFVRVAIAVFLLFVGVEVYQSLYPHWQIEWKVIGEPPESTCFREYSEVLRFADVLEKRGKMTWRTRRMRHCPLP